MIHRRHMPLHVDPPRGDLVPTDPDARGREMARIRVCLEADEVRAEHAV